jgi:hypothetical protein
MLELEEPGEICGQSNPLIVRADGPRLLWGDLHGHSNFSDGTGSPEDYFLYARDVAALDVVALTDHDHWGKPFLDETPEMWEEIRRTTNRFHEPERFVTLLGYEWTSWIHGHRHVLYFQDEGDIHSSIDPAAETPARLWDALRGQRALTFAHHSAGGPVATNWTFPPDPELEPVTEIASVHGSSEAMDSPGLIYSPLEGNFVRDVLDRGFLLGFIGSGDGHDGHPGLTHIASPYGGLAGIFSQSRTREGVHEAMRARRVYATNGPRIYVESSLLNQPMGSTLDPAVLSGPVELTGRVVGTAPLSSVDLIRTGRVVERAEANGAVDAEFGFELRELNENEYVYVRVVQIDGGAAWTSPYFIRRAAP